MRRLLILSLIGVSLLTSCVSAEKKGAHVAKILIGGEVNGREEIVEAKETFLSSNRTFYAHVFAEGHTGSVLVTGAWWYVPEERKIFETSTRVTPEFPVAKFALTNNRGNWPAGEYRFTAEIGEKKMAEKVITVEKEQREKST